MYFFRYDCPIVFLCLLSLAKDIFAFVLTSLYYESSMTHSSFMQIAN